MVLQITHLVRQSVGQLVCIGPILKSQVTAFAKMLERHRYGILSHCDYSIHNGKQEGVNNKVKVIKRKTHGFHDLRYFTLKIYQAFFN